MLRLVTRPLLIIFLTIFVNLVGFGIIIPLLPFYAETFGASPLVIGLLFAVFSLCQLVAAPVARRSLGSLRPAPGADLQPRRHGRQLRDARARAQHRDAVRRPHRRRAVGRQHLDRARLCRRRHRAEGSRAGVRADRRAFGLGFILGPALSGVLARISYTAPIWAAAAITLVATAMAWLWLPETVHRAHAGTGNPFSYLPELLRRPARPPSAGDRLLLLVRVRDLSDDVCAVRRAAVRVRRGADRVFLRGVRRARRR